ncbi:TetR/AcrR family transcriptional regulator [Anthocerotibacter panamensis]|uniref:TetR/AcrR family transcriptional regulator n=1 Tax=Anthocerotibacter panamensis TaxID=2857077 RepID=UPI001C403C5E|nr:TetR/AcrR family transcriptional regulator [Anthocerotibacter panamensis]
MLIPLQIRHQGSRLKTNQTVFFMSKGEQTRARVVEQAAELFNQQGYAGSSLTDIMQATGLRKGGIYNHFVSKEQLALEAFDHAVQSCSEQIMKGLEDEPNSVDQLRRMVTNFAQFSTKAPPIAGGCPLMNTAIESDDRGGPLLEHARAAMQQWHQAIHQLVLRGIAQGEIAPDADETLVATLLISSLEGALMLSKLYADGTYMQTMADHLHAYLEDQVRRR